MTRAKDEMPIIPARHWKLRISDIIESLAAVLEYTNGLDFEGFRRDCRTVDAAKRKLAIIGEAAINVPDVMVEKHPEIPWKDLRQLRDSILRDYYKVKLNDLWNTIQRDLTPLVPILKAMLEGPD